MVHTLVQWAPSQWESVGVFVLLALTKCTVILLVAYVLWVARGIKHGDCHARSLSSAFKDSVLRGMVVPPAAALYNLKRVEARTTADRDVSLIDGSYSAKSFRVVVFMYKMTFFQGQLFSFTTRYPTGGRKGTVQGLRIVKQSP